MNIRNARYPREGRGLSFFIRRWRPAFVGVTTALLLCFPLYAQTIETPAKAAFLIDVTAGAVLLNKEGDTKMPTSSMSKMMTAYMVFDALKAGKIKLEDEFTVSEKAWRMEGSRSFMDINSKVKVEDLIRGLIIQSGNDTSVILAEGLAGSEETFMRLMNEKAAAIGLKNSHFTNAAGLPDPQHYSTPRDLATLAVRLINDFPDYYHYFGEKEFVFNNIKQGNRNPLLYKDMGVDGLKTGHAEEAGYGITASAIRDGRRLILVVNGLRDMQERADESARLMNWGYAEFPMRTLYKMDDKVVEAKVAFGQQKHIALHAVGPVSITLHQTQRDKLTTKVEVAEPIPAPIAKGTQIGTLVLMLDGQDFRSYPLYAAAHVERLPFFAYWWAKLVYLITGKMD